jgi:hypothetical protein
MIHNEEEYQDYSIDDWIDLLKKRLEEENDVEEIEKFKKAIELLNDVKNGNNIIADGEEINDDLIIHIKLISDALTNIFGTFEYQITRVNNIIVMYNDIVAIDLFVRDGNTHCLISFGYGSDIRVVAEITRTLCDIFGANLDISDSLYYINKIDDSFIWGEENIINHLNRSKGYMKINPVIYFDDEERGNC